MYKNKKSLKEGFCVRNNKIEIDIDEIFNMKRYYEDLHIKKGIIIESGGSDMDRNLKEINDKIESFEANCPHTLCNNEFEKNIKKCIMCKKEFLLQTEDIVIN